VCCGSGCRQATGERHQTPSRGGLLRSLSAYHDSTTKVGGRKVSLYPPLAIHQGHVAKLASFPLGKHIVHLDCSIGVPEYVRQNPEMNFRSPDEVPSRGGRINLLGDFPESPIGELNEFQWQALRKTLSEVLPIIQGPPGADMAYVSVTALRILLSTIRPGEPPIIIATHTNHALDQLITPISKSEKNFVCLGGRSSDVDICQQTLFQLRGDRMPPR
jgi:hypothetical protein